MTDAPACTSRNIPLPIQRAVRQRCGFGCVICGMPLYEYEHMKGWANVREHVAEDITLLCDQHHREKTGGLLIEQQVLEANANPFNLRAGVSKPYTLHFSGREAEVVIGSNAFSCVDQGYGTQMVPLSVDDTPLIAFILGDGHLLLNLNIFNEYNEIVMRIVNNQLLYSSSPWDIQLVGTNLKIREAERKILIEIDFYPPNKIVVNRGRFLRNGVEILVRPRNVLITNNAMVLSRSRAHNCPSGLIIGPHQRRLGGFMRIESVPRYLGDRSEALAFERECFAELPDSAGT